MRGRARFGWDMTDMNTMAHVGGQQNEEGGTGSGFARAVTIVAGQYTHRYQSSVCLPGV